MLKKLGTGFTLTRTKGFVCSLTRAAKGAHRGRCKYTSTTCRLVLYTNVNSRGKIIEWYLQEARIDYETIEVDLEKRENTGDEYKKVNPIGKVPALVDGELKLFESGALLLYLADKYGGNDTPEKRAMAAQWVLFANSTMSSALFVDAFREKQMPKVLGALEKVLQKAEFLSGEFSVGDVAVGGYLLYIPIFLPEMDLSPWPAVQAYMKRLRNRPACQRSAMLRPGHPSRAAHPPSPTSQAAPQA